MSLARTAIKYVAGTALASAVTLTATFEGLRLWAYRDPVDVITVCYGETEGVKMGDHYTEAQCKAKLQERVKEYMQLVDILVTPPMPDTRLAALTSFAYNVGIDNFSRSALLRKLNAGDIVGACNELPRWRFAKGKELPGLIKRREAERQLCLKGTS